ncbi:hypothetical protein H4S08_002639 [Coemansia sp. RSA 1365]|nr:hypothetical protein H4S08_002639 [Coemansia sp. RSA 1365]
MDSLPQLDIGSCNTLATVPKNGNSVRIISSKAATSSATPATFGLPSPLESPAVLDSGLAQQHWDISSAAMTLEETEERARRLSISKPVSWDNLKMFVDAENLEPLGRSHALQLAYEHHKIKTLTQYGSTADYLLQHVLVDFIAETRVPDFDVTSPMIASDFLFLLNDFPYYLDEGVEHWVLWCKKRLNPGFVAPEAAVQAIMHKFGNGIEWRYIVNPIHRQSVPQLSHAHVFIKHNI